MSFIANSISGLTGLAPSVGASGAVAAPLGPQPTSAAGDEFHAMVESGAEANGGMTGLFKSIGGAQARAEGALVDLVRTGNPMRMYDATAAMAKFNTQTAVFSKAASKVGQAIDRLTNLQ
jgi:hypothetical protein